MPRPTVAPKAVVPLICTEVLPRDLIPLSVASRLLAVSRYTVRRRISSGELRGWRIADNDWRVSRAEVMQLLAETGKAARAYKQRPATDAPEFILLSHVAVPLNMSSQTIRNWIRNGKVEGRREGKRWYVRRTDVERLAYLEPEKMPMPLSKLSDAEQERFREAASSLLATQEKIEAIIQQAKGSMDARSQESLRRQVQGPLQSLLSTVAEIHRSHPQLPAIWFRGRIFAFTSMNGQMQLAIIREQDIETIES